MKKLKIYDTTLRDGNQAKGISFSLEDKLAIARKLDQFGVDYIEGGWPNPTNPLDIEFFVRARKMEWKHARIAAFGSTCRPKADPAQDMVLKYLVETQAPVITIFGKSWDLHVTEVLRTTLEENLRMIRESVAYLKKHCQEVVYDAEHFFDGYAANPGYALQTVKAARDGGADVIVLCDTNGGQLPWDIEEMTAKMIKELGAPVGVHLHNDTGTGVASSLAAARAGAVQVQGTINGFGERCGNANLTVIMAALQLKMGFQLVSDDQLKGLRGLSLAVSEIANLADDIRQPYVGEAAFAHKGGAHIDGVMKIARSFEHIDPSLVGNARDFIVSNQSGSSLVWDKIKAIQPDLDKRSPQVAAILADVKQKEDEGYHFEIADASFQLLARRKLDMWKDRFDFLGFRSIEERRENGEVYSEFTIKLKVGDEVEHTAAEGNGPVDAMNAAVWKALRRFFPVLANIEVIDYKVRVLDNNKGTGAKVRVWISFHDKTRPEEEAWGTLGVSTNIIEASWLALLDGINYKLLHG
ncbi:MAG: 2-isopropylmalate synthase/homocitrate synthase family protein [Fibrobacteres bacterium]|nr:2-isopropylmalate synthase/homocitrate synthase family protein [Fibrobacterota bacterium]